jgi:hypothetical protein
MDESVARMSNADRLSYGPGLPMSDRPVDIGPVEQHTPSTSSQPSLAQLGQWIRRGTKRYTHQSAAFQNSNYAPPDSSRANHFEIKIQTSHNIADPHNPPSLTKIPLHGTGAPHRAPRSVAADIHHTQVPSDMVVCRQHTQHTTTPPRNHTTNLLLSTSYYEPTTVNMSSNSNHPPTSKHMLCGIGPRMRPLRTPFNPRSCHAGHPLAPLNNVPQPPPTEHDLGTAFEPSHGKGLQTPLVLAAPRSITDMGRAADLSTRSDDPYRCDRPAPSHSKDPSNTQRPLLLAYADTLVNIALKLIPFPHLCAS